MGLLFRVLNLVQLSSNVLLIYDFRPIRCKFCFVLFSSNVFYCFPIFARSAVNFRFVMFSSNFFYCFPIFARSAVNFALFCYLRLHFIAFSIFSRSDVDFTFCHFSFSITTFYNLSRSTKDLQKMPLGKLSFFAYDFLLKTKSKPAKKKIQGNVRSL